jgi:hypothetical protein
MPTAHALLLAVVFACGFCVGVIWEDLRRQRWENRQAQREMDKWRR